MSIIERLKDGGDALLDKTVLLNASKVGYLLREPTWDPADTWVSMRDKVCIVNGANSGLGRVVSTRLAGLGARVYLLCRSVPSCWQTCSFPLLRTPEHGADTLLWLAVNPRLTEQESGQFWFDRRPRATRHLGFRRSSEAERASYWDLCCRLAGCTPDTAAMH